MCVQSDVAEMLKVTKEEEVWGGGRDHEHKASFDKKDTAHWCSIQNYSIRESRT